MGGCQSRQNLIPNDSRHVMLGVRGDTEMRNSYREEDLSFDLHLSNFPPSDNESTALGDRLEALNSRDQVSAGRDKHWRRKTVSTTLYSGSSSKLAS